MKYYEITFTLQPCHQDARDVLSALAAEAGFESFEDTDCGLRGYVQQQLFLKDVLDESIACFPFEGTTITYEVAEAEDKDWNEQWEQEGFEPIAIGNQLVIHDGRHTEGLPAGATEIVIDAKMAFGTGTHETTRMMCAALLDVPLEGLRVLDCGCGTGILGICALKQGAAACVAYDIDAWSVANTRHNAEANMVAERMTVMEGDARILDNVEGPFDVVMANINRNILLEDMARFRQMMHEGSLLLLSGFYEQDREPLEARAAELGLVVNGARSEGQWAALSLVTRSRQSRHS